MNTLRDLHEALGGVLSLPEDRADPDSLPIGPVAADSRKVAPGGVYWALPGPHHNGEEFADEAFSRGAAGAVVGRAVAKPDGCWVLRVDRPQRALWQWAAWTRRRYAGVVIAAAGGAGRAMARQMIHAALKARLSGLACAPEGGQQPGLPLDLLDLGPQHDYGLFELESCRAGADGSPVALLTARIGVFAPIADQQMGRPNGRAEAAAAELLASLPAEGLAVLADDPWLRRLARGCEARVVWTGEGRGCDVSPAGVQWGRGAVNFTLAGCRFHVPAWGKHGLGAALAAIVVARALGLEMETIASALGRFEPVPGDRPIMEVRGAVVLLDPCDATPASMRSALALLREFDASGRRIFVCGDLAEGGATALPHRELGRQAVDAGRADLVFAGGKFAGDVAAAARTAGLAPPRAVAGGSVEELLPRIAQAILPGDVVLVAGVRGLAMERVADALQRFPRRRAA